MKKAISLILTLAALLSLWGCGGQEPEQSTPPAPRETVHYGPVTEESAPAEVSAETATEGEFSVEVKDVFVDKAVMMDYDQTYYFHIPSIHINGVNTDEINQLMYQELYSFIDQYVYDNPDYPYLGDMGYLWGVNNGIVSVITEVVVGPDSSPNPMYVIYNVDIATGQRIEDAALVEAFGLEVEDYREQVRSALERTYLGFYEGAEGDFYQQQYENTVSDANVSNALPYIDVSGQLCVAADVYSLAGGDSYRHLVALSDALVPAYPKAEPFE